MTSKTRLAELSRLAQVLPGAQFSEYHSGLIDAPVEEAWAVLHDLRWRDLALGRLLMTIRAPGSTRAAAAPILQIFSEQGLLCEEPPISSVVVTIGKPWSPEPQSVQVDSLDQLSSYDEPGWLKYGMEWLLVPLPDGRTLIETRTLCEATDRRARLVFGAYWTLIRAGSGLIRRELIASIRRQCESR